MLLEEGLHLKSRGGEGDATLATNAEGKGMALSSQMLQEGSQRMVDVTTAKRKAIQSRT